MLEINQRNRKMRQMCLNSARLVEYDDEYTSELCPNCFHALENNNESLFTLGWKDKWEYLKCKNCDQVIRKKP